MSREEIITANDELRTTLKGGTVLFTPDVFDMPAWFRGRVLFRMTQAQKFMNDEHSEGVFSFGGTIFYWFIGEFAGERTITLSTGGEATGIKDGKPVIMGTLCSPTSLQRS